MRFLKYLSMICLMIATQVCAKISVDIQPNPVAYGNPIELIFRSETHFYSAPNLSVLQNDFVMGGQQQRQSSSWVNGVSKSNYELAYTLFPNKAGKISIPSFKIGQETTSEQTLTVLDKSASGGAQVPTQDGLELNISCDETEIYPQQIVHCVAELVDPIGVRNGELVPPSDPNLSWQPTSEIQLSSKNIDGKNVRVLRQNFILKPLASGKLQVPAFLFQGSVVLNTSPARTTQFKNVMDLMFMDIIGSATRPVSVMSKPFSITVLPKPSDWTGWWLPSTDVTLNETYQMPKTIHAGESIERTVTLKATDVAAETLPVPTLPSSTQIKVYTGVETRQDLPDGSALTVSFTIIPIQSGEITLPSISVPWFDTKNHVIRYAVVPERTIFIEGSDIAPVATTTPKPQVPQPPVQPTPATSSEPQPNWMFWAVLGAGIVFSFAIGVIVTLLCIRRRISAPESSTQKSKKKKPLPDLYPF